RAHRCRGRPRARPPPPPARRGRAAAPPGPRRGSPGRVDRRSSSSWPSRSSIPRTTDSPATRMSDNVPVIDEGPTGARPARHILVLPDRDAAEEVAEALPGRFGITQEPQLVRDALAGEDD